jgi:uncharacterized protein
MTVDFPRWTYAITFDDVCVSTTSAGHARYEITDGDPLSAVLSTEYKVDLMRPDTTIGHHSTSRLSCDAQNFHFAAELNLTENGQQVFHRAWKEKIPRDML